MANNSHEQPDDPARLNDQWVQERLRAGLELAGGGAGDQPPVSEEELAAFALGELPPGRIADVLAALENNPDAAELVAEMFSFRMGTPESSTTAPLSSTIEFRQPMNSGRSIRTPSWLYGALAVAACVMLSISAWVLFAPAAQPWAGETSLGAMTAFEPEPDYWQQLSAEERAATLAEARIRELVLFASVACTAILAVIVCFLSLRRPKVVLLGSSPSSQSQQANRVSQQEQAP